MAWTDAARQAALEARRRYAKAKTDMSKGRGRQDYKEAWALYRSEGGTRATLAKELRSQRASGFKPGQRLPFMLAELAATSTSLRNRTRPGSAYARSRKK